MLTLGDLVRQARERHGVSAHELAARVGVDAGTVEAIERGAGDPGMTLFDRLLDAVGEELAQRPDGSVYARPISRTRRP